MIIGPDVRQHPHIEESMSWDEIIRRGFLDLHLRIP